MYVHVYIPYIVCTVCTYVHLCYIKTSRFCCSYKYTYLLYLHACMCVELPFCITSSSLVGRSGSLTPLFKVLVC